MRRSQINRIAAAQREVVRTRKAYEKAADRYLTAVKATDAEEEMAVEGLTQDKYSANDALDWAENLADTVLSIREDSDDDGGVLSLAPDTVG